MPQSDFISYLVRKGALRNAQELDAGMAARRRDSLNDIDWIGMTKRGEGYYLRGDDA